MLKHVSLSCQDLVNYNGYHHHTNDFNKSKLVSEKIAKCEVIRCQNEDKTSFYNKLKNELFREEDALQCDAEVHSLPNKAPCRQDYDQIRLKCRSAPTLTLGSSYLASFSVRIYAKCIRPDINYKTVPVSYTASCHDVIVSLLVRHRVYNKDPSMFYLGLEVADLSRFNLTSRTVIELDNASSLHQQLACSPWWPAASSKLRLRIRSGSKSVRIYDGDICPTSIYTTVMLAPHADVAQTLQLLAACHASADCNHRSAPAASQLALYVAILPPLHDELGANTCRLAWHRIPNSWQLLPIMKGFSKAGIDTLVKVDLKKEKHGCL